MCALCILFDKIRDELASIKEHFIKKKKQQKNFRLKSKWFMIVCLVWVTVLSVMCVCVMYVYLISSRVYHKWINSFFFFFYYYQCVPGWQCPKWSLLSDRNHKSCKFIIILGSCRIERKKKCNRLTSVMIYNIMYNICTSYKC